MKEQILNNQTRYLDELFSLLRIPSISSKIEHKEDMMRCAERWCDLLRSAGVDRAVIMPTSFNPVVYAERIVGTGLPTVLVYGHYDVMPVDPIELWHSDPFDPVVKDGKIWGRGADDDKGQSFIQVKAFELLNRSGELCVNVKFLLEGGEEVSSPGLDAFLEANKVLFRSDIIVVSDTSMVGATIPSITTGLRGLAYMEMTVVGPNRDLHSGLFGGAVANPLNVVCKLLADVTDVDGRITIPGFYDDVEEVSALERAMLSEVPFDDQAYQAAIGVRGLKGEVGYSTLERTGTRPTFDICGMWGGYTGEGSKTVLPSRVTVKLSFRLVPHQDYHVITALVKRYFESVAPDYVCVEVNGLSGAQGYVCPIALPAYKAASDAYERVFGKRPLAVRRGGSIGVVALFEKILGTKTILMGFGLEEDATHSPNENFPIDMMWKGIETVVEFYRNLSGQK